MRTTLSIADDMLDAAKAIASHERRPLGDVVSELMRQGLGKPSIQSVKNGIRLLPVSNPYARITLQHVNELRDEAP